jgi:hypothetical protein
MPNELRVPLWEVHLAAALGYLASVDTDYPCADLALREKIRAGWADEVKIARGFIEYHSKK